jgi:hypothetical protein
MLSVSVGTLHTPWAPFPVPRLSISAPTFVHWTRAPIDQRDRSTLILLICRYISENRDFVTLFPSRWEAGFILSAAMPDLLSLAAPFAFDD